MNTHDIGPYYWHHAWYPTRHSPLLDRMDTQEIEAPYRYGRAVVLRAPRTRLALVVGKWRGRVHEDTALLRATGGRVLEPE